MENLKESTMESIILQANDGASARIYTHGAHLSSWIPAGGHEQLFLSKTTELRDGAAIRGGVPVIFPQFATMGSLPRHGFARTALWRLVRSGQIDGGAAQAVFALQENIARLQIWPHVFRAELTVTVFGDALQMDFSVVNSGDTSFQFTCALHTYCTVAQIGAVRLHGLQGLHYRDSTDGGSEVLETMENLSVTAEIDRIYAGVSAPLELRQPHQRLQISQTGFNDAVVWNPGAEKGSTLSDLESDGYQRLLCVEAGAVLQPIRLVPGGSWSGSQRLCVSAVK